MADYYVIGKPAHRVNANLKVMGQARYSADIDLPGTLWEKSLHNPYAHARIVSINTTAAKQVPGVHAVITGADVRAGLWGRAVKDAPVLAYDRVRYAGERVAAVAAEDEDIAQRALALIDVEYDELPAVFEPEEAMRGDAPILHPDFNTYFGFPQSMETPSNIFHRTVFEKGDLEAGSAAADVVIEQTYVTQRQHQAYLEPQAVLIHIDDQDGRVHVWLCSKVPYNTRESLATAVGIPESQMRWRMLLGCAFAACRLPRRRSSERFRREVRRLHVEAIITESIRRRDDMKHRSHPTHDNTAALYGLQDSW